LPLKAFTANPDAVAHRAALGHDEIEELGLGIDDDGARLFFRIVSNDLTVKLSRNLADRDRWQRVAKIPPRTIVGGKDVHAVACAAGKRSCQTKRGNDQE